MQHYRNTPDGFINLSFSPFGNWGFGNAFRLYVRYLRISRLPPHFTNREVVARFAPQEAVAFKFLKL